MFYLTNEYLPVFIPLGFIGVYRWFWFTVRVIAYLLYKPLQPRKHPKFLPGRDVTIVVPTIDAGEEIQLAIRSWLKCNPFQIIFVTVPKAKPAIVEMAAEFDPTLKRIKVITISRPNKRNQMVAGINHTKTDILVFCDDDALWPPTMLEYICAPFEDPQMGGVGTSQNVIPVGKKMTVWEILAAYRISMRNLEITASTYIDGGICCLSGRTAAYRTSILRDPDFQWKFTHEYWMGKYLQHSGDDKFLTRWMHSHYWKTFVQACPEAELLSTFKNNSKFLLQLLRWTRNTWRSDIRSVFFERHVWSRHPYVAYTMVDKFFNPLTLLAGPATVIYVMIKGGGLPTWTILVCYMVWLFLSRLIKYMPHFVRRPMDCIYIPVWIVFNIYFVLLKIYCLFTLYVTDWGTRSGADDKNGENDISEIFVPHWDEDDEETIHSDELQEVEPTKGKNPMYQLPNHQSGQGRLADSFMVYGIEPSLDYSLNDVGSGSLGLDFQESVMGSEYSEGITTMNLQSSSASDIYESDNGQSIIDTQNQLESETIPDYLQSNRTQNTASLDFTSHDDYLNSLKMFLFDIYRDIVIKSPKSKVWSIIVDIEKWPVWDTDIERVEYSGPQLAETSGTLHMKNKQSFKFAISKVEQDTYLSYVTILPGASAQWYWKLEGSDSTNLRMGVEITGLFSWVYRLALKGALDKAFIECTDNLAKMV